MLGYLGDLDLSRFQVDNSLEATLLRNLYDANYKKEQLSMFSGDSVSSSPDNL